MSDAGRSSIILFGLTLLARIVGFLGLVYFARVLPQSELGIYFLFFLVVQLATLVSGLGIGNAIVQRVSSSDRPSAMFSAALTVLLSVAVLATICSFLFQPWLSSYIGSTVPLLLSLAIAGWLLADLHIRAIQAKTGF